MFSVSVLKEYPSKAGGYFYTGVAKADGELSFFPRVNQYPDGNIKVSIPAHVSILSEKIAEQMTTAFIEAVKKPLKVGDVPLYKRDSGQYVLHRIVKIKRGEYTMKGDNRTALEKGITDRHIIGVLTGIVRNGKTYPVETAQEYLARISGSAPAQPKGIKAKLGKIISLKKRGYK